MELDRILSGVLSVIDDGTTQYSGAYNIRYNGQAFARSSSKNIQIVPKTDKPGIDIIVKPGTKCESVHIPVVVSESGKQDTVYNDFYIGEGADVKIVAGCGIHNDGDCDTSHEGIHVFHIAKNASIVYEEKHFGEGGGTGNRILNPRTEIFMEENSVCKMDTAQIKGVDSTLRQTTVHLGKNAKLFVWEKLMTHESQVAESDMVVNLNGEGSSAQIISRSVSKDSSVQTFHPQAVGNAPCTAHIQCDSIIMDSSSVRSIPEICANNAHSQIIHEAAIGRINSDQLLKLQTLGLTQDEAEVVIIDEFRK